MHSANACVPVCRAGRFWLLAALCLAGGAWPVGASAQQEPGIGYMFPSGGQAGQTIEVTLGGYDWTPDMQLIVQDPRVKLELTGVPGPVLVPEPPYWFGKKARRSPFLLPRETRAKLTIPADMPPGLVRWQVANANGASAVSHFAVGHLPELVEIADRTGPQQLTALPVVVSGQIKHIEEVDLYRFTAPRSGPLSATITARAVGSELNAVLEIYNAAGELVADAADTASSDTALTFTAKAGETYTARVYDLDFRGNRAFVYRLSLQAGPRVVAAVPAVGRAGQTQKITFLGYGVATGAAQLESVERQVAIPADASDAFLVTLTTPHGDAALFSLPLTEQTPVLESALPDRRLTAPLDLTGVLDQKYEADEYVFTGVKGDKFMALATAASVGARVDASLAIIDAEGNELVRTDDLTNSTDAQLEFTVPADGEYRLQVSDYAGRSGDAAAVYRLQFQIAEPGYSFETPEVLNLTLGGTASISLKVTRSAGFMDPIALTLVGLPKGVTVSEGLEIPAKKSALKFELTAADTLAAATSFFTIQAKSYPIEVKAPAKAKAPPVEPVEEPEPLIVEYASSPILLALVIPPPFQVDAEGKDDVTKWPRGTIFPAPVLIERNEGFLEPIILEMASKQGRHRQGISGPELQVEPGVERILYPVYLPEWLETTRTSRMIVNGVAQVKDPQGNVRYSLVKQKTRMGFLPTGALLKLSADATEIEGRPGDTLTVPFTINCSQRLSGQVQVELAPSEGGKPFSMTPMRVDVADARPLELTVAVDPATPPGEYFLKVRAQGDWDELPAISAAEVFVRIVSSAQASASE
ncbi:hypothetical protein [Lignipirellula cremea]|uniref:Subtilase-type serine protease n=1 Tax=Lignipirellula cremea TaxID=2528010 RepID=A0A518E2T6_9BACT|nr:hypothetical protein [Lignipirellula cremea]QDU98382.1 hypothetical protein Pla8534_62500 [Lignipirellula cremea]